MKLHHHILSLLIILLVFSGCKKKVNDYNQDYIGHWYGNLSTQSCIFYIDIDENNEAKYSKHCENGDSDDFKGIARVNENKLKIGIHPFKVLQTPKQIDTLAINGPFQKATWQMKLKSPPLWGGYEVTYYKE